MSPREKGRYLREAGWRQTDLYGRRLWSDPLNPARGALHTNEAVAEQRKREDAKR